MKKHSKQAVCVRLGSGAFSFVFRKWLSGALLGATLLLGACDAQKMIELIPGESSEAQVRERFGKPDNVWDGENGEQILEYNRQPAGHVNYMITIDADGKLKKIHQTLVQSNFDKIQPGMPMEAVRKLLGKPAKEVRYALSGDTHWDWRFMDNSTSKWFTVVYDAEMMVKKTGISDDEENSAANK
jgi:hypothetical protein